MRKNLIRSTALAALALASLALGAPTGAHSAPAATRSSDSPAADGEDVLSTHEGWNGQWAVLFSINNVLQNSAILSPSVMGSLAGAYYLNPTTALRAGVTLGRTTNPAAVTKTVTTTGGTSVTTYAFNPPGFTELDTINLRADYLKRILPASISPYFGGGLEVGFSSQRLSYLDDLSVVDQRTEVANRTPSFNLTARGLFGVEWRFHSGFAVFAEYSANLTIFRSNDVDNRTTMENTVGGATSSSETTTERTQNTWFDLSTGLAQGANFGLEVIF
jgi:hypothetical protein